MNLDDDGGFNDSEDVDDGEEDEETKSTTNLLSKLDAGHKLSPTFSNCGPTLEYNLFPLESKNVKVLNFSWKDPTFPTALDKIACDQEHHWL